MSILLLLLGLASRGYAQGIFIINPVFAHVDSVKKLVLLNAPLSQLRAGSPGRDSVRVLAVGSRQYKLAHAVAKLSPAAAYRAVSQGAPYTVFVTQVPVLAISTRHQIVDTPSVYAHFELLDTTGVLAQSAMGIEFRGATSQTYPKKSFELSLWADTAGVAGQDLALLGLRTSDKWNLQALYNDQLRVRLKVANELWQDIDQVYYKAQEPTAKNGIDMAYTEVFINDSYQGVYALTERIDRKQLALKKYSKGIMGELYKGTTADVGDDFASAPPFNNNSLTWGGFEYKEPSEQTDWTNLHDLVEFVATSPDSVFYAQYQSRFNLTNMVDYFLFLNLMRAADNTAKNIYVAKYKANEPYYYAPWDLDGVLGNDWSGANVNTTNDLLTNKLYDRLLNDYAPAGFREALVRRWVGLRAGVVTAASIKAKIAANTTYLLRSNIYAREHLAWPEYTYDAAQLGYSEEWLAARLAYLDGIFAPAAMGTAGASEPETMQVFPNPASGSVAIAFRAGPCQFSILDVRGRRVLQTTLTETDSAVDISALPKGIYLARIQSPTATVVKKLLVE